MFLVDVSYSFTELFHRSSLKIRKCQYIYVFVHSFSLRRIFCKLTFFSIELLNSDRQKKRILNITNTSAIK